MSSLYLYRVTYRRQPLSSRVYHMAVPAATPDEARAEVARRDPEYTATVRTPRRSGRWLQEATA
jgi:hypothetical protein